MHGFIFDQCQQSAKDYRFHTGPSEGKWLTLHVTMTLKTITFKKYKIDLKILKKKIMSSTSSYKLTTTDIKNG